jgi:tripartite-type tricarboxylate transporter receptor subunit TctC
VGEFLPGYEASGWYGIGVPKGTTPEIAGKLNKEINTAVVEPKMKDRLADLGAVATPMTPSEFGKFIADEVARHQARIRQPAGSITSVMCRKKRRNVMIPVRC